MKFQFNKDGWTDWLYPTSRKCPVGAGWYVLIEMEGLGKKGTYEGLTTPENIHNPKWKYLQRYKMRKPKGLQSLQDILEKLPVDTSDESGYKEPTKQKQGA